MELARGEGRGDPAHSDQQPRVLLFSQENIYEREAWRSAFHEFENLLREIEAVEVLAPRPAQWYSLGKRISARLGNYFKVPLNPGIPATIPSRKYDIFFAVCEKPSELLNVNTVRNWKRACKASVCWLTEFYVKDMEAHKSCLEILSQFDFVFSVFSNLEPFRRALKNRYVYLAPGVDALRFCPYPDPPTRGIELLSIGRRAEETHIALLKSAARNNFFYVYDTLSNLACYDIGQHRALLADMAKRSRYFIVNPAKVDMPSETGNQSEFGYRYFEGAAAGALLIGERPRNDEFEKIFHWQDALIDFPFGGTHIGAVMKDFDRQPGRQAAARRNNIVQMLRHHDWVYRWEQILNFAQTRPTPALLARKHRLRSVADHVADLPIAP